MKLPCPVDRVLSCTAAAHVRPRDSKSGLDLPAHYNPSVTHLNAVTASADTLAGLDGDHGAQGTVDPRVQRPLAAREALRVDDGASHTVTTTLQPTCWIESISSASYATTTPGTLRALKGDLRHQPGTNDDLAIVDDVVDRADRGQGVAGEHDAPVADAAKQSLRLR